MPRTIEIGSRRRGDDFLASVGAAAATGIVGAGPQSIVEPGPGATGWAGTGA